MSKNDVFVERLRAESPGYSRYLAKFYFAAGGPQTANHAV